MKFGFLGVDKEGTFFELMDGKCVVGVFVMKQDWEAMPPDVQGMFKEENFVQVKGLLGEFQGDLELEMLEFIK